MITVPSCKRCNEGFQKDDTYFCLFLTLPARARGHPDREKMLPNVLRSLNRPQAVRLNRAVRRHIIPVEHVTSSGIYLGRRQLIGFDIDRIERTAVRIIKGLHFLHFGQIIIDEHRVCAIHKGRMRSASEHDVRLGLSLFYTISHVSTQTKYSVGTTFNYSFMKDCESPGSISWILHFYGNIDFICITSPLKNPPSFLEMAKISGYL